MDYVDPANLVWSYTEDPNFEDLFYIGEVKSLSLSELNDYDSCRFTRCKTVVMLLTILI